MDDADDCEVLFRKHQPMVLRTCMRIVEDHHLAQDAAQETFLCLMRHRDRLDGCVAAWLHRVARSRSIDALRSEQRRLRPLDPLEVESVCQPVAPTRSTDEESGNLPVLREALLELEPDSRRLVHRHFVERVDQTTLATELQVSQATISRRLGESMRRLRQRIFRARR